MLCYVMFNLTTFSLDCVLILFGENKTVPCFSRKVALPPTSRQGSIVPAWEWTIENGIYSGVPNGCFL